MSYQMFNLDSSAGQGSGDGATTPVVAKAYPVFIGAA